MIMNWTSLFDFERGPDDGVTLAILGILILLCVIGLVVIDIKEKRDGEK